MTQHLWARTDGLHHGPCGRSEFDVIGPSVPLRSKIACGNMSGGFVLAGGLINPSNSWSQRRYRSMQRGLRVTGSSQRISSLHLIAYASGLIFLVAPWSKISRTPQILIQFYSIKGVHGCVVRLCWWFALYPPSQSPGHTSSGSDKSKL